MGYMSFGPKLLHYYSTLYTSWIPVAGPDLIRDQNYFNLPHLNSTGTIS